MAPDLKYHCVKCNRPVRFVARSGLCARCMLAAGLSESLAAPDLEAEFDFLKPRGSQTFGRLSRYELIEEIARGGMGVVYRARDTALNRGVALKMILTGQFASERDVKRFRAEAEAAARLDHPNIVPIYEVGEENGRPFFSMKFMEGGTLTAQLAVRKAPLDPREAASLLVKIARAVHHAHQRAILHRDIKPGNILLDAEGEPYVSDFGLAKCLDSAGGLTLSGTMIGSPSYMSPEQAAGESERLTTASDTYSLGALLYELLTGQPPFKGETPLATMKRVIEEEPDKPSALNPAVDRDLEIVTLKCLEKEPQRRFASADALAEELERWLRGEPIQARPCSPWTRLWKWTRRQPTIAFLALISVLAMVAFVVGQTIMSLRVRRANAEVRATNTRLSANLYELRWRQADEVARTGERHEAIAWFSYFLRQNPRDSTAAARLLSLLSSLNFPQMLHPPLPHDGVVSAMDFGQMGDRLVTMTSGGAVRTWNVTSGELEAELDSGVPITHCILVSEHDRRLLTLSMEPKARLWDLGTRRVINELILGPLNYREVARTVLYTRDRRLVALNVQSNVVAVLDAESDTWLKRELSLPEEIRKFAFSGDGRLLATHSGSGVQVWDVSSGRALFAPTDPGGQIVDLQFSEDGLWLACLSVEKVSMLSTATGVRESEFKVRAVRIHFVANTENPVVLLEDPTERLNLVNFRTGQPVDLPAGPQFDWLWLRPDRLMSPLFINASYYRMTPRDPSTGRPQSMEALYHAGWIVTVALHPNRRIVATGSQDRTARIWSMEMERAEPLTLPVGAPVFEAKWSPSGEKILTASASAGRAELRLWDARTALPLGAPSDPASLVSVAAWAPDGTRFATASFGGIAQMWDGNTGEALSPPLRHDNPVVDCEFSPDGQVLATASDDQTVRLWDGKSGKSLGPPLPHSHTPLKVSFTSNGSRILTAGQDGTVRVWSVPDGELVLGPLHHDGTCWVAHYSPDERWIVSASSDGTARVWDATSGKPVLPPLQHEGSVLWASFSPDGKAIITTTDTGIGRVWNASTGEPLSQLMRHPDRVWLAGWSTDGRLIATTCVDGSARIWDASSGHLLAQPFSHQEQKEVRRAEFSPDGNRLLTASFDGTAKIWDLRLLHPPMPTPDWLPALGESLAGKRIDAKGAPVSVSGDSFQRVKERIAQAGSNPDYYARWANWMLEERLERPVKPFRP